jgi:hypothetical protein
LNLSQGIGVELGDVEIGGINKSFTDQDGQDG